MIKKLLFLMVFFLEISTLQGISQNVYYVNINSIDNGNGLTPTTPSKDLFAILQKTIGKDEVRIATGIYETPASGSSFDIFDKLWTQGAGPAIAKITVGGGWNATFTEQNPLTYPTVLKQRVGSTSAILYVNRSHIDLYGLTFQDADKRNGAIGGAIQNYAQDGSFVMNVKNCIFKNNKCNVQGGAVAVWSYNWNWYSAQNNFDNCTFDGNSGTWGGACVFYGVDAKFNNCTFVNNYAGEHGGALHQSGGGGTYLNSCTIVGNTAGNGCGGFAPWTNGFAINSIIAGNKTMNNANSGIHDVNQQVSDNGNNIFGCYASLPRTINSTTRYVTIDALNSVLESNAPNVYPDHLFSAKLANNGGSTLTVKLLTTSINTYATNIPSGWATTKLDNKPGGLATDQRGIKRAAGNTCVGAYEYRDPEFELSGANATWSPDRGAVTFDVDFYKYKKDVRFYHDMYVLTSVIDYSTDGINFTPLVFVNSERQPDQRGAQYRNYSVKPCYGGTRFQILNKTSSVEEWKTINEVTEVYADAFSNTEVFTAKVQWQIPTELLDKKIYFKYRVAFSDRLMQYTQELISPTGTKDYEIAFPTSFPQNLPYLEFDVTTAQPPIITDAVWQNDGTVNYSVTTPASLAANLQYQILLNGENLKQDYFSTLVHNFTYSVAEISKVKKYTITASYSPNPDFPDFPRYSLVSNETIVKAYTLPEELKVVMNGCEQKNTISFTVPAMTETGNFETSNYELCRAIDSTFVTDFKVLGEITYDAAQTDYTFTESESLGINQIKTYYYKLRRISGITAWAWKTNVRVGMVKFNTTHKKIKDITATIENGKPAISWNYTAEGVFCAGSSKITVFRFDGTNKINIAEINDENITSYIDETNLATCTPYTYSLEIGSAAHGTSTATATNKVMVPLSADEQPVLEYLKASKGFYNDRVDLEWNLLSGTLSRFLVQRKLYEESSDNFATVADINLTASKLYKYQDFQSVPSMYYTYRITAVADCNTIATEAPMLSNLGFRMPTGSVGGRIVYAGDVPVENANIIIQGADEMKNRAIAFGNGIIGIPDKNNLLSTNAFAIQAWLNLAPVAGTVVLFDKKDQFQLLVTDAKLQIKVGAVIKEVTGFTIPANTYFHLSLVMNSAASYTVFINGIETASLAGFDAPVFNTDPLLIGAGITGYLDELRIWEKALLASEILNNYDRYISGKETGIKAYYRLDEKINEFIFDMSAKGITYNENHGYINGTCSRSEFYIPTSQQLSLKGKTDANGNYLVAGIPYFADGTSYTFTPNLGTHEFNPKQKPLFLSDRSAVQNNVDFVDISSFKYEGYVVYEGGNYPVEGVSFTIDGRSVIDSKGALTLTDVDGKYSIKVPIGEHVIEANKYGHNFSAGKISRNFQADVLAGFKFEDATRIKLIGRVVGGKRESDKTLLFSKSKNNIGVATIVLEPLKKDKYNMRSSVNINQTEIHPFANVSNSFSIEKKAITIKTNAATGEFIAYVYPEDYKVLQVNTGMVSVLSGTTGIYLKNSTNAIYETREYKDSVLIPPSGNQLAYYKVTQYKDSVMYNAKFTQTLYVDPDFSITEFGNDNKAKNYNGELFVEYSKKATPDLIEKINLLTFENQLPVYALGRPVYTQGNYYKFSIKAFEKYVNADNAAEDLVPVSDGKIWIDNTMKLEDSNVPEVLDIDSTGYASYVFVAGLPDLTTGINKFDAYLQKNGRIFTWANKFEPYLFGSKSSGANFTTAGPDKVVAVLRDPPGTSSYSYLEAGSTVSTANSISKKQMFDFTSQLTFRYGPEIKTFAGLGFGVIMEASVKADFKLGLHIQQNSSTTKDTATVTTTTKRFQTSADPLWVGADADVFIGLSTNFVYGATDNISVINSADIDLSFHTVISDNGILAVVKSKGMSMGQSFGTDFAYTQRDIEKIFIPAWKDIRNRLLLPKGTIIDRTLIKQPVYVSNVAFEDPNFASRNTDKKLWGANISDSPLNGPSYQIILPEGQTYLTGLDSVMWCNNQIATWQTTLANNEKQKIEAKLIANQSFTSGSNYEYSTNVSCSSSTTTQVDYMISALAGMETGWAFNGLGLVLSIDAEVGGGADFSTTTGSESSRTVGFVMEETGDFDALTVDYKRTADGGISFNTRAGQTSCPYEGAKYTKYYQPGTILSDATMQMEVPKISVVNSMAANVPANRNANFTLELKNESEVDADGWYRLLIDGSTNPDGAILKIDGAVVNEAGQIFLVKAGQTLRKTLTLTKGPNALDYKNIRLILASTCQYDPTGFTDDIFDDVSISASFIPNCSDINLSAPLNNWVMNTTTGDSIMVKLEGYDVNYANFGYVALQSKTASASVWNEEMKFFAKESLFNDASGAKTLLDLTKNSIQYNMPLTFPDNTYDIRAVAYCIDPTSKAVLAETPTLIASGIKDMVRPVLFGLTQPADGILNVGDEIQIQFNEDISEGIITHNNFSVTGIKNGAKTIHTSAVHFDGIANKMVTEQSMNLSAKSFTFEIWMKRNSLGTGTIISHGSTSGFEFGFTAENKLYVKNASKIIESESTYTDISTWNHYAVVYDLGMQKISVYVNGDFAISDQVFGLYYETGMLRLGASAA
ncbi:MAG TPA: hypothetical protein DCQ31_05280, partial [Bacteroidales bacterium]|nr:hypothetical protein [Bacteroidales bacterium]